METLIDLDLNYNNVQSDVLKKDNKRKHDVYQDLVTYASKSGITQSVFDDMWSSIDADESTDDKTKFQKAMDSIKQFAEYGKDWGATREGQNLGESLQTDRDGRPASPPVDVRILGMKPLVFSLVSIGVILGIGVGIARLGKK